MEDEISLVQIINVVVREWRLVVVLPIVLMVLAGALSLSQTRRYVASASFIPQAAEGGAGGGAAALAERFGVNLGTERLGQSPQFYVELLRSASLLRDAVESEYEVPSDDGGVWRGSLVEYWELDGYAGPEPAELLAREILDRAVSTSVSRETGIVRLSAVSPEPALAEQILERLLELLNQYNLEVRRSRAQEEGRFIGTLLTDARAELRAAEGALQNFLRQNREFGNSPELAFEYDRLQRQVLMRQELYTSLLRSQEQARIDGVRDTPLFTVIDHPAGSAEPRARGTVLRALLGFAVGLVLAVILAFLRESVRRGRGAEDPHVRELHGLVRQAWSDAWRPHRWIRRRPAASPTAEER